MGMYILRKYGCIRHNDYPFKIIHFLEFRTRARLEETSGGAGSIQQNKKRKLAEVIEELDIPCELDADSERVFFHSSFLIALYSVCFD